MDQKKAHFIGIGGIGVSALARYFLAQNWLISGSDVAKSKEVIEIQKQGAKVKIGHKSSNIKPDVVYLPHSTKLGSTIVKIMEEYQGKSVYPHTKNFVVEASPCKSAVIVMMSAGDIYNLTGKLIR